MTVERRRRMVAQHLEQRDITDPRVRKLADEIIAAQRREIDEMKALIEELEAKQSTNRSR